ncbi:MAG: SGNH/GDSL hydrolase family protein, partial [Mariniblastus sp.]|nr:SGNH/GDSL hydrolase family protein [Mariniblastus sp.]
MNLFAAPRVTRTCLSLLSLAVLSLASLASNADAQSEFTFKPSDKVCFIGNTLADRMQHYPWLETYLTQANPDKEITFRNLGFAADEIKTRPRSANFGTPDQWLSKCEANVIFCFFGYNEALRGESGLSQFENDLATSIDQMLAQQYDGKTAPRLAFFSPIAHENLQSPHLPDGSANNGNLKLYTDAMQRICDEK